MEQLQSLYAALERVSLNDIDQIPENHQSIIVEHIEGLQEKLKHLIKEAS